MEVSVYDFNQNTLFAIYLAIVIIIPAVVILFDDGKIHTDAKK